jgi:cathepsin L
MTKSLKILVGIVLLLVAQVALIAAEKDFDLDEDAQQLFDRWCDTYKAAFASPQEYAKRLVIFKENIMDIKKLNKEHNGRAEFGLNEFSALTKEEFLKERGGVRLENFKEELAKINDYFEADPSRTLPIVSDAAFAAMPASMDWRNHTPSVVTPVKDQTKYCGSCWSFSTTGTIEAQWALAGNKLVSLSEQNLIDCVKANKGCHGGMVGNAITYILKNKGIDTEASYPYEHKLGDCRFKASTVGANVTGFLRVPHNASSLAYYLATKGPISVGVDADTWKSYKKGVLPGNCGTKFTHWVLLVGYGTSAATGNYWLIKNSWGARWGMQGYIMLPRSDKNVCGILNHPVVATVR